METYGKILLIAMPAFLLLVIFEKWYGWKKGFETVKTMDAISSLASGVTNVTKDVLGLSIAILGYEWMYKHWAITHIGTTWVTYVIIIILLDFAGYAVHALQHKVNFFWNAHVIHHSSEEFNLACALRQSISIFVKLFALLLLPEGAFDYKVVTPWKLQTGASFVHPNFGLIGIEYELSNPSKAKFKFDDNDPSSKILEADLNQNIAQKYDWSQTIKVGLESKWKNMRFRAGMQAQSSPFSDVFKPKTDKNFNFLYSGGLGYKGKKFSIDAAYARGKQTSTFVPYSRNSDTPIAAIESIQQNITISVGYKF